MPGAERLRDSAALTELVAKQVRSFSAHNFEHTVPVLLCAP